MDKQPTLLSPEGDAELKRLYADLAHASRRATAFLRTSGMTSPAFLRADREVTRIVKQIKEIRGLTGKHWMALLLTPTPAAWPRWPRAPGPRL
jgi:hypothetical protein